MLVIGGLVFLLLCVFGSYVASGGSLGPLMEALPFELLTIGGAAAVSSTLAISSTARTALALHRSSSLLGGAGRTVLALSIFFLVPLRKRRALLGFVALMVLVSIGSLIGCGSGSKSTGGGTSTTGTTAGAYAITVTASASGAGTQTTTVNVTVN